MNFFDDLCTVTEIQAMEQRRARGDYDAAAVEALARCGLPADTLRDTLIGSAIFAEKPGDGSAREQAASDLRHC